MITHQEFLKKYIGKRYVEPWMKTAECVWLAKLYCEKVYGIKWLFFWWTAYNWWLWKGNLDKFFDRPELPRQWDLVFFSPTPTNHAGHIWIHNDEYSIIEQNWGVWGWTGLGVDAIRIHKWPTNYIWCMRPKPISMEHFLQYQNPDCSLLSTINCYRLNNGNDARSFTQEVVNWLMQEYINKTPRDAFNFLKAKKYNIKYVPLDFKGAKTRLNKGSAVVLFIRWLVPSLNHYTCIKKIDWKYHVFDSTTPTVNVLDEIDTPYNNGIFNDNCCQIR